MKKNGMYISVSKLRLKDGCILAKCARQLFSCVFYLDKILLSRFFIIVVFSYFTLGLSNYSPPRNCSPHYGIITLYGGGVVYKLFDY